MNSESELLQKLMVSKKIMEKHNDMGRGQTRDVNLGSSPMVENYEAPPAKYNLPQEFMQEQQMSQPVNQNLPMGDRIANSKLPDDIKRLMMEHPIQQPNMGVSSGSVLSNELIEKASRLMNSNAKGEQISETQVKRTNDIIPPQSQSSSFNANEMREIIRETVEEVLHENGLLIESETRSSDVFKFRVGQHIFEGKVTKIKKIASK
jgi:hypothetical protein